MFGVHVNTRASMTMDSVGERRQYLRAAHPAKAWSDGAERANPRVQRREGQPREEGGEEERA